MSGESDDPRDVPPAPRPGRPPALIGAAIFVLVIPVLCLGIYLGGHPDKLPNGIRDAFVGDGETQTFNSALDLIQRDYYRKVPRSQLFDRGLGDLVAGLHDQFSSYYNPKAYRDLQQTTAGKFAGIGVNVAPDRRGLKVTKVYPHTPASREAIRAGDVITRAAGRSLAGRSSDFSTNLIKGPADSRVSLTVARGKSKRTISITRALINVPDAEAHVVSRDGFKLAHLNLTSFTAGVHGEAQVAIDQARKQGAKGIVLDLRGNGGGLLTEARLVGSLFIPQGKIVVTRSRSRGEKTYNATGSAIPRDIPVVALVDRGTASASEIVAGALQDTHRAEVVGTRTFGKGVFQEVVALPNKGALEITVGEFFLPSGRNLGGGGVKRGAGIKPDVYAVDKPATRRDEALETAYSELVKKL